MSKKTLKLVKGVYSYEYMDSFEKFFGRCDFSSSLKDSWRRFVRKEDYLHPIGVWNMFINRYKSKLKGR